MSHVVEMEVEINDLDALEAACKELGLKLVRGQKTYKWYGHSMGDYALPNGFTEEDLGKCDHAIRIPNNPRAYEIGVVQSRTGSGYTLLWDFWQGGYGMQAKVGENGEKLAQSYTSHFTQNYWQSQGYEVTTETLEDGRVVVRAEGY